MTGFAFNHRDYRSSNLAIFVFNQPNKSSIQTCRSSRPLSYEIQAHPIVLHHVSLFNEVAGGRFMECLADKHRLTQTQRELVTSFGISFPRAVIALTRAQREAHMCY